MVVPGPEVTDPCCSLVPVGLDKAYNNSHHQRHHDQPTNDTSYYQYTRRHADKNNSIWNYMSRVVKKTDFCICENKDADQLRGNREADQRLCFRYLDSTIPLLPNIFDFPRKRRCLYFTLSFTHLLRLKHRWFSVLNACRI